MKNKFDNSQVAIAKLIMDNLNGPKYEISFTPNGNLMFKRILDNEHFVISKYNDMYFIRRYAYHLDRCYRICPSSYIKHTYNDWPSYIEKVYGHKNFTDALMTFAKFIEKNR